MITNNQLKQEIKTTGKKIDQEIETINLEQRIKATGLIFDEKNVDRTWEAAYGIVGKNILLNERGTNKLYDNRKLKSILEYDSFVNVVGRNYVIYPNQEVIKNTNTLIQADPTLKLLEEPNQENPKYTNHGLNMFITLISDENSFKIKDSHEVGDLIQVGVVIRNSLGGGMGLGADLFTYRLSCLNGAIFKSYDLGNDYMRHYGKNPEKVTNAMRNLITHSLERVQDIKNFYQKMAEKKLGDNNRQSVFKKLSLFIPQKSYPAYVDIEAKRLNKDSPLEYTFTISEDTKKLSMWQVFNDFTKNIWHADVINFEAKRYQTMKLHQIIIDSLRDGKVN